MSARGALTCDHDDKTTGRRTNSLISLRALVFLPFPLPFYTLRSSALLAFDFPPTATFSFQRGEQHIYPPFFPISSPLLLRIMHSGAPSERLKKIHTAGLCSTCKGRLARWYEWFFSSTFPEWATQKSSSQHGLVHRSNGICMHMNVSGHCRNSLPSILRIMCVLECQFAFAGVTMCAWSFIACEAERPLHGACTQD